MIPVHCFEHLYHLKKETEEKKYKKTPKKLRSKWKQVVVYLFVKVNQDQVSIHLNQRIDELAKNLVKSPDFKFSTY